ERAGGVNRDDPDGLAALAERAGQRIDDRRLARARRPGDADEVRASGVRVERSERSLGVWRAVFDAGDQAREGATIPGQHVGHPVDSGGARHAEREATALRMCAMVSAVLVPGPKTALTPISSRAGTSSSGMMPPTSTITSS